ncbi:hypothetical protein C8N40_10679 [Pontibacter mucosus]|uniref:Tetratricopeptide repeat-containing protein n=2 Tax=Pontibacter TaxID=323449 RepID=A0A1I2N9M8_9BACT|nr:MULTISPECIES: hypothetical protein [Pontibacter]PTX18280.1 hypothetical protein C8N40_10679 [Pontibacter mucosus]SFF99820.1 hypothetical protein SAMN05421739_101631 [Pontibacter chinhatensis]
MANLSSDPVFQLVKSLTRSEKRHFRLFTKRQGTNEGLKFLQLFDVLDRLSDYEEERILEQMPELKKVQLPNLKANLYKQLLSSLRLYHANQNLDIQLLEQLGHARVLYNKGLYRQCLKLLDKVKTAAKQAELQHIALAAIDFEKQIESQFITRSLSGRADSLSEEATELAMHVSRAHELSNLALRLYGVYIQAGHAKTQEDYAHFEAYFRENLPDIDIASASFMEKLYYYQAHVWYHYLGQDFKACYRFAQKWVNLFEDNPEMKNIQSSLYIKGLHNLLAALFNLQYYSRFEQVLQELEQFAEDEDRRHTPNTEAQLFLYGYTNRINAFFMRGDFEGGVVWLPNLLKKLEQFQQQLDPHRQLIFYFKIASLYFGSGDNETAIRYLNKIINYQDTSLRVDIQCFARILRLIAYYEAGDDYELELQIRSVYRFLGKMNDQHEMQVEIFRFLRRLGSIPPHELKHAFVDLKEKLTVIAENPFQRRPFLYLDIISWLESKIENIPVQEIIRRKFSQLK